MLRVNGFTFGPPFYFICKNCGYTFRRNINVGIICPKCKSLKVVTDKRIVK